MHQNYKIAFVVVLVMTAWGGFKMIKGSYTAFAWEKTRGTVVDFESNTWSCGRGVSRCYELVVGYHAGKDYFIIKSDKKFNNDKPTHLLETKIPVYYSPDNAAEATLGGAYGTGRHGFFMFLFGSVILFIFWFFWQRNRNR